MNAIYIGAGKTLKDLEMPHANANDLLSNGLSLAYWAIGILSVVVIVYASFRIVTARGDVERAKKGRLEVVWGMVGLGIALLASFITGVVINVAGT